MITINKLKNGLTVVNEYMSEVESVSINIWVRTGSRNENRNNNGISHFLEHMAFKGTTSRNTRQIAEDFDDIGGRVNAFTSVTNTAYYTKVLKEKTERAVELLADIFQNSIFLESEIEKEKKVILQELAMTKDDPNDLIQDYFLKTVYKNQSYGRSIIGTKKNIENFSRENLISYVNSQYLSEDIVVSFAGNLKEEFALKFVNKYLNKINIGKNKQADKAIYTNGYFTKNKTLEQVQLIIGFESFSYLDPHFYELHVLSTILGGGMSSRLFQEIREKRGLCYNISVANDSNENTGIFIIESAVAPEKTNELISTIFEELKKMTENIQPDELERAIIKFKSALLMKRESNFSRAEKNASNLLFRGRIISIEEMLNNIESITIANLKELMQKIITQSKPSIAVLGKNSNKISYKFLE